MILFLNFKVVKYQIAGRLRVMLIKYLNQRVMYVVLFNLKSIKLMNKSLSQKIKVFILYLFSLEYVNEDFEEEEDDY